MSTVNQITGQGATPDAEPTKTRYDDLAEQFIKGFDTLTAILPPVEVKHTTNEIFVKTHQNVPDDFVITVNGAVEQSDELMGVKTFDPATVRDRLQYNAAIRPVADKIIAYGLSLMFTADFKRALNAADTLQMYAIAKGVARKAGNAHVGLHVQNMKRDLGKKGRGKGKATAPAPAPDTNPAPAPQQPPQSGPHAT
jgi:hypothetical protein